MFHRYSSATKRSTFSATPGASIKSMSSPGFTTARLPGLPDATHRPISQGASPSPPCKRDPCAASQSLPRPPWPRAGGEDVGEKAICRGNGARGQILHRLRLPIIARQIVRQRHEREPPRLPPVLTTRLSGSIWISPLAVDPAETIRRRRASTARRVASKPRRSCTNRRCDKTRVGFSPGAFRLVQKWVTAGAGVGPFGQLAAPSRIFPKPERGAGKVAVGILLLNRFQLPLDVS